ncbi:uncharacterized protein LOC108160466 [Drosophila miranda]|uniref:uncharacterized protein LOC108160466 n=1 Tax=Drosophila miranda TaxID=7229 RepID=UPI0007E63B92|nr:uncharacterized protein LOC108160466 [Drosophila miranda]
MELDDVTRSCRRAGIQKEPLCQQVALLKTESLSQPVRLYGHGSPQSTRGCNNGATAATRVDWQAAKCSATTQKQQCIKWENGARFFMLAIPAAVALLLPLLLLLP